MVAVEAANVVRGEGAASRACFQIKKPGEPAIAGIHRVKASFTALPIVHIHTEEDLPTGDDRRRFDLVPLTLESANAREIYASSTRIEAPDLPPGKGIERVDPNVA
jgi:hypothetical protein